MEHFVALFVERSVELFVEYFVVAEHFAVEHFAAVVLLSSSFAL